MGGEGGGENVYSRLKSASTPDTRLTTPAGRARVPSPSRRPQTASFDKQRQEDTRPCHSHWLRGDICHQSSGVEGPRDGGHLCPAPSRAVQGARPETPARGSRAAIRSLGKNRLGKHLMINSRVTGPVTVTPAFQINSASVLLEVFSKCRRRWTLNKFCVQLKQHWAPRVFMGVAGPASVLEPWHPTVIGGGCRGEALQRGKGRNIENSI